MRKTELFILFFTVFALLTSIPFAAAPGDNLSLTATVTDYSGAVREDEMPEYCLDGKADTKWCSENSIPTDEALLEKGVTNWIVMDLGEEKYFNRYVMLHASLGAVDFDYKIRDAASWILETSPDKLQWTEADRVENNTENRNERSFDVKKARYVRLLIIDPTQNSDETTVRLPEFQLFECDEVGTPTEIPDSSKTVDRENEAAAKASDTKKGEITMMLCIIGAGCLVLAVFYILKFTEVKKNV